MSPRRQEPAPGKGGRGWTWGLRHTPEGPISETVREELRRRLEVHVRRRWTGREPRLQIRFRGAYAYVDAFPHRRQFLPGTTEEQRARIAASPTHLCRLGWLGEMNRWQYAFYKYSDEKYALSVAASGSFEATPEQAFDSSCGYLGMGE